MKSVQEMYYLWKDKNGIFYITDYKEIRSDGLVKIDSYGYIECELVFSHKIKTELINFAERNTLK